MDRPWVTHYDPSVPDRLDYPNLTLPQFFDRSADRFPDRIGTVFHGRKLRYREIQTRVNEFAGGLVRLGIRPADRVALMLPNLPQYVIGFFGTLRAGAIVVPTNPLYTARELRHQLADSGAVAIVTLDQLFGCVQEVLDASEIRTVILTGVEEALPVRIRSLYRARQLRSGSHRVKAGGIVHRFGNVLAGPESLPVPEYGSSDDLAVLQYTGGTTGLSRGAMLTHRNLLANALQGLAWQGGSSVENGGILCVAPFFHVYGMSIGMNLAVAAGATMLLVPRWSAPEVAKIIRKQRPMLFPGVPTMYHSLANVAGVDDHTFSSLRVCLSGAAPLPPDVQRRFQDISGARLVEGYGLTEASPVTHCNPVHGDIHPGTVGVPFPDTDARITDSDTWETVPLGSIGEMTVRGPQVMRGYWNRPQETEAVLRDGWLHTGDLASQDEDGYFRIVDRKKDLIIAGGYNVYPREVEDVLYDHPAIDEAAVIGVPNEYRGETVKAVVVVSPGASVTAEEIIDFCRTQLAAYKCPKIIEFREHLPKTLIGKVLRRELREDPTSDMKPEANPAKAI